MRETLVATLDIEPGALCDDVPLTDYGLDSMLAVQAVEVLNTSTGAALTTTSLFDYPCIDALVAHILSMPGFAPIDTQLTEMPRDDARSVPAKAPSPQPTTTARIATVQAIAQALVDVAGIDAGDIQGDVPFVDYGIDSMLAVQIVEVLNQRLAVDLTTTSLFDHPTINALVEHLGVSAGDIAVAMEPVEEIQARQASVNKASVNKASPDGGLRPRVLQMLSAVLEIDAAEIDPETPFTDYGLDSMLAVQWVERLNESLHLELTTTSPFDYPTLDALMQYILQGREEEGAFPAMETGASEAQPVANAKRRPQPMSYTI